ncbi:MAG: hypothetical protein H6839_09245 [Planctomycetes bacterium]|nr:hypothetical protein [Planctomycetota bacterium]
MRISVLFFVLAGALALVAGCSSGPEVRGDGPTAVGTVSTPTKSRWSTYLQVMSDKERTTFLDIADSFEREQWIRRNGIDVRADLDRRLSRGISVDAAKRRIEEAPDEVTKRGDSTMIFYSRYNTESRTNFWLLFRADQLVSWNAHTIAEQDRERHLLEFESALMDKFDTVLKRGIGMAEINRNADNARDDLNRVELHHREKIGDPDFKGARQVSSDNYLAAEDLLYARSRNELFEWFQGREPDHIIIHRPFETHQYFMTYTDLDGTLTVVTAEFIFENGLLQDWFVYHER